MGQEPSRRTVLARLAGACAVGLAGCGSDDSTRTPVETPADGTTRTEAGPDRTETTDARTETATPNLGPFEERVDAVSDLGCDATGETPCDSELISGARAGRLVEFPPGTYQLGGTLSIDVDGTVGLVGRGDVTLVPPSGFNEMLISAAAPEFLLENVDVDVTEPDTTAGITVDCEERFHVESITYRGRGTHPDEKVPFACNLAIRDPSGTGVVRDVTARQGSAIGHYKNASGRGGIWIGPANRGTIRIEGCRLEEFGNNGVYASRTAGNVQIVGGVYRNNNVGGIRIGGAGSYVRGATVEVDLREYDGPRTLMDDQFATRGIILEQGGAHDSQDGGAEVADCEINMLSSPQGGAAISIWSSGRTLTVRDTRIRADIDGFPAVFRAPFGAQGENPVFDHPRHLHLENVEIVGGGDGTAAVQVFDAPGCRFRNCQIDQTGPNRDGIRLTRSPGSLVDGGSISAPVPLVVVPGDVTAEGECLVRFANGPRLVRTSEAEAEVEYQGPVNGCLQPSRLSAPISDHHLLFLRSEGDGQYYVVRDQ